MTRSWSSANKEMANVVLSIDGRKEVNDRMRPFRNGKGSYDLIVPKFQKFADSRDQKQLLCAWYLHTATIWISHRMYCILRIWDLSRSPLSRLLRRIPTSYAIREEDLPTAVCGV